jgi:hypothetical protein
MKCISQTLFIFLLNLILPCQPLAALPQVGGGSLSGTVVDTNGAVLPKAEVTATLKGVPGPGDPRLFRTETDEEGRFLLENLDSGVYDVRVRAEFSEAQTERVVSVPEGKSIVLEIEFGRGCDTLSEGSGIISDEDKAEIIRSTLAKVISPESGLLMSEQRVDGVILSSKNIKPEWIKSPLGVKIKLMSQRQIQQKADRQGDFLYMSFPEVRVRGTCVAVTVANSWAVGKRSRTAYLSGGGYTYEYRKESGKWVGKIIGGWVS